MTGDGRDQEQEGPAREDRGAAAPGTPPRKSAGVPDSATAPESTLPLDLAAPPPDPRMIPGLHPGKALQAPFRHPTKHFVMLPAGAVLRQEVIDAIRLMGCERQAIACLGEIVGPDMPVQPDVLQEGPQAAAKIDRDIRILRQARDILALFLGILFIFALALRMVLLVVLTILAAIGWGVLHMLSVMGAMKIERITEAMDAARVRRLEGEKQLQEAAIRFGLLKHERLD